MADNETIADIIAWLRRPRDGENAYLTVWRDEIADRLEAAHKREADSIHRAMVILAGIEMPDADYPPRLWTALEDAYNALSDALGTDGDTTADEEEAKSSGRHFVIQPRGDAAELRDVCEKMLGLLTAEGFEDGGMSIELDEKQVIMWRNRFLAALAAPPRNCDVYTSDELKVIFNSELASELPIANEHEKNLVAITAMEVIDTLLAPATEKEGGAK